MSTALEKLYFNHGWGHFWFEPKNVIIKEFIKGPFVKPKALFSVPYVTLCQQDGDSIRLTKGIPDCWAEYLAYNLVFPRQYLRNYELMHKEDVEIVPQLRKNYRLYIGQGIPDPLTSYEYIENPKTIARKNSKDIKKNLFYLSNNKKDNCYCCEKKYLFECPDAATVNGCPCRDCHSKNEALSNDCGGNCKCISALRDWVIKNTELKRRKKQRKRCSGSEISSSGSSRTEDECRDIKAEFCECLRRFRLRSTTTTSEEESNEKPFNKYKTFYKNKSKVCSCPLVKNFYLKRNPSANGHVKTFSKQIQTDNQPPKDSKTVQTDNSKSKLKLKCQCSSKCSLCGLYHCKVSWPKLACAPGSNFCFPPNVIHNPAFICPYLPNHVILKKPSKSDEMKKINKKEKKMKVYENGSNVGLEVKQNEENVLRRSESQESRADVKNDNYNGNKNIYYCQPSTKGFDRFKNLIDKKYWPQSEELHPGVSNHSSSKFVNFCSGDPSACYIKPERFKLDKFKDFSYNKPKYSESYLDSRMIYMGNSRSYLPRKLLHSCDQATMTGADMIEEPKNENLGKLECSREMNENEYKICSQISNKNESYRANRRRRKLLANRKRRRKLAASGKSSILECQVLHKLLRCPELANKQVQVEGTDQENQFSRKVFLPENDRFNSSNLNFSENTSFKHKDFELNPVITETLKKIEENPKNHWGETSRIRTSDASDAYKQSLWSDSRFNKTLEKISSSGKGTWTSAALKNIVDDILLEKR